MAIEEIILPDLSIDTEEGNFGRYVISPFYPGYGTTIGNALRRILLTSLPGSAVTAFRVDGAHHEFSTVPGVKEDLIQIMLHLKSLRLRIESGEAALLTLKATKPGLLKASHIKAPSQVTIINPDLPIATVTGKGGLELEIMVEKGRGYRSIDQVDVKDLPIGTIVVDSIFTPVNKVSYTVENTRVGARVDYDKLTIEITTDGSVAPREVLKMAAQILIDQLGVVTGEPALKVPGQIEGRKTKEDVSVEELNLSVRTANTLLRHKIKTLAEIEKRGMAGLKEVKGLGAKAYNEILEKLQRFKRA